MSLLRESKQHRFEERWYARPNTSLLINKHTTLSWGFHVLWNPFGFQLRFRWSAYLLRTNNFSSILPIAWNPTANTNWAIRMHELDFMKTSKVWTAIGTNECRKQLQSEIQLKKFLRACRRLPLFKRFKTLRCCLMFPTNTYNIWNKCTQNERAETKFASSKHTEIWENRSQMQNISFL